MATAGSTTREAIATAFAPERTRRRTLRGYMRAAWQLRVSVIGGAILLVLTLIAIFAPLLTPYTPEEGRLVERLQPPVWQEGGSWDHPLGTDGVGRDYLTRLMYGGRVALSVG